MFYNSFRATRSSIKEEGDLSQTGLKKINPRERLLNLQKRKKLKELLIQKFSEKYDISNINNYLDNEVTSFVQKEKINDFDLQRLNNKIRIMIETTNPKNPKNPKQISEPHPATRNKYKIKLLKEKGKKLDIIDNSILQKEPIKITLPKLDKELYKSQSMEKYGINNIKSQLSSNLNLHNSKFYNSKQEKELAELEEELKLRENSFNKTRRERLDFSKEGDEWSAIALYKSKLFQKQMIEEKIKENEMKKKTKEFLDNQVKEKMIKEQQEQLKQKEYDKSINEYLKKMDEIEKNRAKQIKLQIMREKEINDSIIKQEHIRKRIEELKEKKKEREFIKRIQEKIEEDKLALKEDKKLKNEELNKMIKENEIKKEKLKEEMEKQKKDDIILMEDCNKHPNKQDYIRNRYFQNICNNGNRLIFLQAENVARKMKEAQKKEDEKMLHYFEQNRKKFEEDEIIKKLKKKEERIQLKTFLDKQVEEKKKAKSFLKELDNEQARIWNYDSNKYKEDTKMINRKIKDMNRRNLNYIIKQINDFKKKKNSKSNMTDDEYYMNIGLLEKAKDSLSD